MKNYIPIRIKQNIWNMLAPIPRHLSKKQEKIGSDGLRRIEKSLEENYHTGWRKNANYSKAAYRDDVAAHLYRRLESDRRIIVPWLDAASSLKGKRILEIGCGTGSSTIAIAEQGSTVTGIDIDEGALAVACERASVYGVNAQFRKLNAEEMAQHFGRGDFDAVIFFACLEHMTLAERLASIKSAWELLAPGGVLAIIETPNRLWYHDGHTSELPFFNWLPDELAFRYARFSPKDNFQNLYDQDGEDSMRHFLRRGRGVSFHELEVSICSAKKIKVISSLSSFARLRYRLNKNRLERKYKSLLMDLYPNLHEGFFDDYLNLIIEKTTAVNQT